MEDSSWKTISWLVGTVYIHQLFVRSFKICWSSFAIVRLKKWMWINPFQFQKKTFLNILDAFRAQSMFYHFNNECIFRFVNSQMVLLWGVLSSATWSYYPQFPINSYQLQVPPSVAGLMSKLESGLPPISSPKPEPQNKGVVKQTRVLRRINNIT